MLPTPVFSITLEAQRPELPSSGASRVVVAVRSLRNAGKPSTIAAIAAKTRLAPSTVDAYVAELTTRSWARRERSDAAGGVDVVQLMAIAHLVRR